MFACLSVKKLWTLCCNKCGGNDNTCVLIMIWFYISTSPGKFGSGGADDSVATEGRGYEIAARRNFYFGRS